MKVKSIIFFSALVLFLLPSSLWSEGFFYVISTAVEGGESYAIISDVVEAEDTLHSWFISDQFQQEWIHAYAEELTGIDYFCFDSHELGPYSTHSEAERERRKQIGDYQSDDYKVYDITRLTVPTFRYEE